MARFQVWGPLAQKMELQIGEERRIMQRGEQGWWSLEVAKAGPGTDYGFCIDGEGPFPDPRSPYQPAGVHGLSRLVDQTTFAWTDENFQARPLPSGLLYELHVGTFTPDGTFDSLILKLGNLRELGVTHIELLPVAEFPGEYGWGYDGVDLYAPYHGYGGPEGLKRLVNASHAQGIGVIMDVVYNHLGPAGNYLDRFGPYHSNHHQTAWGAAINFDGRRSDEVRAFVVECALMWLRDYHIDGLRLDAVHEMIDNSAVHILEELSQAVDQLEIETGRRLALIAESDLNDPRLVRPVALGGYGLDAVWSDDFHHALHVLLTGESHGYYRDFTEWADLAKALTEVFVYHGRYSQLRGRRHGRPVGDLPGYCFLGYLQNHDQIGNRAQGERIGQMISPGLVKVAAALVLTAPFTPMLFMGEEWGAATPFLFFTDHEPELGRLVSEGRRNEFGASGWKAEDVPDPQETATFIRSKLDWTEPEREPHHAIRAWYQQLIALRRRTPALLNGRLDEIAVSYDALQGWLLMERGIFVTACNLSEREVEIPFKLNRSSAALLASEPYAKLTDAGVFLPPESVLIFQL